MIIERTLCENSAVPHPLTEKNFCSGCVFFDMRASGHYWRTGVIESAVLVRREDEEWIRYAYTCDPEKEDDEFLLLTELCGMLPEGCTLITFNGKSSVLPFLSAKYKAYDLPDPFAALPMQDLYHLYRPLYYFLRLPSRRLSDHLHFSGIDVTWESALPALTHLLPYLDALNETGIRPGDPFCVPEENDDGSFLLFSGELAYAVPRPVSFPCDPFYLYFDGDKMKLTAKVQSGSVRRYFTDYTYYEYLPEEGCAVHRSVASFLPKDRRVPATAETAFILVPAESVLASEQNAISYFSSAMARLRSVLRM